ncbi:hypothetical protein GGS23DRAFT_214776 [Durotheca rogersii]|uniref:uncharacterized protein n=1 Tax=Durotheca rogersii TaxID=419775 RepID=UPI00221FBF88|nr:uncharacterized protein GGS23DRAFT_214776 [Durotheca rogersii]KAI5860870.1 hypothetical protein GGS23DRAFT_214776 [Durotheca rogersii]
MRVALWDCKETGSRKEQCGVLFLSLFLSIPLPLPLPPVISLALALALSLSLALALSLAFNLTPALALSPLWLLPSLSTPASRFPPPPGTGGSVSSISCTTTPTLRIRDILGGSNLDGKPASC